MATAIPLKNDRRFRWGVEAGLDGAIGYKSYRVNTSDDGEAITAIGLPPLGQAFDPSLTGLTARQYLTFYEGGQRSVAGEGGWTRVEVVYRTDAFGGSIQPPPGVGNDWTEVVNGQRTAQVIHTIDGRAIANGQGASKQVAQTELVVHQFRTEAAMSGYPIASVVALKERVNNAVVTLPRFLGLVGINYTWSAGQLRFIAPEFERPSSGVVEILLRFETSADHLVRWRDEDEHGQAVGAVQSGAIYDSASFAVLNL